MNQEISKWDTYTANVSNLVKELREQLRDTPINKRIHDGFKAFDNNLQRYKKIRISKGSKIEDLLKPLSGQFIHATAIGNEVSSLKEADQNTINTGNKLVQLANTYYNEVEKTPLEMNYQLPESEDVLSDKFTTTFEYKNFEKLIKEYTDAQNKHHANIKSELEDTEERLQRLKKDIESYEEVIQSELEKSTELYIKTQENIDEKQNQINDILGLVSGRAVAGDFETSAADEKKMADWLRYGSLACMGLIVIIVGTSFWETTQDDFMWQNSIVRIILATILSFPAAYLAKESTKHRQQQYQHLQTSLDLKALDPYIASLPDNEQHKIKIEIANRIFASRNFHDAQQEQYPINVQEIIMEVIKKLDLKK